MRKLMLIVVGAAVTLLSAMPAPALAWTGTRASCIIQAQIVLSSPLAEANKTAGTFQATRGKVACAGTFAGTLTDGVGWLDASGTYANGDYNLLGNPLTGFDTCALGNASLSFFAATPVYLSNRHPIKFDGTLRLNPVARILLTTGSGRTGTISPTSPGSIRISYTGIGSFIPDHGQDCTSTPIRSGTLTETLVVTGRPTGISHHARGQHWPNIR